MILAGVLVQYEIRHDCEPLCICFSFEIVKVNCNVFKAPFYEKRAKGKTGFAFGAEKLCH